MSWQAVQEVMEKSASKGSERLLLMVIATHADKDSLRTFIGLDSLCKESNMKRRNLIYTLQKLEESGELKIDHVRGSGNVNTYSLTLPENVQPAAPFTEEKKMVSASPTPLQIVQPVAPLETCSPASEKVQSTVKKVQSSAEKVQSIAPIPIEPSNQKEKEKPSRAKREGVILANREGLKLNEYIGRLLAFRKSELNVKKLPSEGKEVAAAKWLFDEEWAVQQVKDCYHALKKHRWRDVDVDLRTIANQIAAWSKGTLNGGGNGSNRNSPEKKPSLADRAREYNEHYGRGGSQARAG
jgi:hypothetical protein